MSKINSSSDIISLLQDIEHRGQQGAVNISQQEVLEGSWSAIGFRVAQDNLLIPLDETREVFTVPAHITPTPKSQPWVVGIANLRGELLPLFDLKYFLYGQKTKINKRSRIIVFKHPDLYSGLLLDEVFGLKHFQQEPEYNAPTSINAISPYLNGSINEQDAHWDVFSFNKLAADQRFFNAAS